MNASLPAVRRGIRRLALLGGMLAWLCGQPLRSAEPVDFDRDVAPVLIRSCLVCHSGATPEGELDLSSRELWLKGGATGPAFDIGTPAKSLVADRIRSGEMPPKAPLADADRETLLDWIAKGANWGSRHLDLFSQTTADRAGYDWWSLQPLRIVTPPPDDSGWCRTPIDRFVADTLAEQGLSPAGDADQETLIRRLSYDLLGLPPTPEDVAAFVADSHPDAYDRLVDRLLASPHYGVRWGRHWLDIVRFGESQGFERDKLRDNGWPYRDWVIEAFNVDRPYDEFARLQIAGDVTPEAGVDGIIATGFLVCGPWDEVGQKQQSAAMRAFVRQDELEDYVSAVGQTFLGLTVHCARCHDHKFDPIRQEEYYRLAAAFDGVHHGDRKELTTVQKRRREELTSRIKVADEEIAALLATARERVATTRDHTDSASTLPLPLASWMFDVDARDSIGGLHGHLRGSAKVVDGALVLDGQTGYVETETLSHSLREKTLEAWVSLDRLDQRGGGVLSLESKDGAGFDAIVYGERQPGRWMVGSDHFARTQNFAGGSEELAARQFVHVAIVHHADGRIAGYRNGLPYGEVYRTESPIEFTAGSSRVLLGLRHSPAAPSKLLEGRINAAQLYDRALTAAEVAASAGNGPQTISEEQLLAALSPEGRTALEQQRQQRTSWQRELDRIQPQSLYAVSPQPPRTTQVLLRGNPTTPAQTVSAGGLAAVSAVAADFGLAPDADDAQRRRRFADWMTSPDNPLFARVIVNRLWHYHFGSGLVATTSDFGFSGGQPTHPDLLDWLATELLRSGMSLKTMHRLIVTSSTYRQASTVNPRAAEVDRDNRWLWRMSPHRLEAETLRDAILVSAGELNTELGGPGYQDFETYVHNSQFYEIQDRDGPEFQRRTIYRTWIRSARSPLLDVFDCPDPSTKTPSRAVTITPLQALSLMNNSFVLRMSGRYADRVKRDVGDDADDQVARAARLAWGRDLTSAERETYRDFVGQHGLAEFCRVLLNSNEFLVVD